MIILIDKPSAMTSHDVVASVRRACIGKIKIGHTGTLDPICTGVLPVLTGRFTKLSDLFPSSKAYTASVRLGVITDTQDITGTVVETRTVDVTPTDVEKALKSFIGTGLQVPPMYSAIKKNGVPLYKLARQGIEIERTPREITVTDIVFHGETEKNEYSFSVYCSAGTYIRTICEDLGTVLGCGGTMTSLRRILSNGFRIEDCHSLEDVVSGASQGRLEQFAVPLEKAFSFCRRFTVNDSFLKQYVNGGLVPCPGSTDGERFLAYTESGVSLGLCDSFQGNAHSVWNSFDNPAQIL